MSTTAEKPPKCPYCGLIHSTTCPRIKAIEYADNGMIKRIEFHPQGSAGYGDQKSVFEHIFGRPA